MTDSHARPVAALEIVRGAQAGQIIGLEPRDYSIGRGRGCDIVLLDGAVSRQHAFLRFDSGGFEIEDAGSAHGVYVDSARVERTTLQPGNLLTLGGVILRYARLDQDASTTSSSIIRPAGRSNLESGVRSAAIAALDRLRIGIVLVEAGGKVLLANRTGEAVLAGDDALRIERGILRARDSGASRALADLLRDGDAPMGGAVVIPRDDRRPLTVMVTPLKSQSQRLGAPLATKAVFISDPERGLDTSEDLLTRLYDLTPTEARVTTLLAQGLSLEECGDELAIAVATVRSHLKSIFQKTDCRRQSELVRLLLTGPSLLREG